MTETYQAWIAEHYPTSISALGNCSSATRKMVAAFPELKRCRGHYYCYAWGPREHWWCETAEGEVVDPTAKQFPSLGLGHYEPLDESLPQPTGKCPNCGEYCYDGKSLCSEECEVSYLAYLNQPFGKY